MATNMDRSLDEILADRKPSGGRGRGNNRNNGSNGGNGGSNRGRNDSGNAGSRRRDRREEYPRDGVRKSYRDDPRKIDEEWVHDRYDDDDSVRHAKPSWAGRGSPERGSQRGTKIRVENIHYELTKEDIEGLFRRIGPVLSTELVYDRAGRSDGVAYVTYEIYDDAKEAIREFDGANAKGQPIRLSIVPSGRRAGLDGPAKVGTGRPLAERVSRPGRGRNDDEEDNTSMAAAARRGIDRYVPRGGDGDRSRSRSPRPRRREGGRRPGERRGDGRGGGEARGEGRTARQNRPKKTQEELDAEMEDYFGETGGAGGETALAVTATAPVSTDTVEGDDEMDMIG